MPRDRRLRERLVEHAGPACADCHSWPISASTSRETAVYGSCARCTAAAMPGLDAARGVDVARDRRRELRRAAAARRGRGADLRRAAGCVVTTWVCTARSCSARFSFSPSGHSESMIQPIPKTMLADDELEQHVAHERDPERDRLPVVAHDADARRLLAERLAVVLALAGASARRRRRCRRRTSSEQPASRRLVRHRRRAPTARSRAASTTATDESRRRSRSPAASRPTRGHHSASYGASARGSFIRPTLPRLPRHRALVVDVGAGRAGARPAAPSARSPRRPARRSCTPRWRLKSVAV